MFHKPLLKAYFCAALILTVCLLPGSSFPTVTTDWVSVDKLVHLLMYIPLTWLLAYGFREQTKHASLKKSYLLYAFIIACVYGAFIELLQFSITPDRAAELYDFFADALGAAIAIWTINVGMRLILFWNTLVKQLFSIKKNNKH